MLQKVTEGTSRKRYMLQLNSQVNFAVSPQVPQRGCAADFHGSRSLQHGGRAVVVLPA